MIVAHFGSASTARAYGLTQWDYGQVLEVHHDTLTIPDGAEVQFYQGNLAHTSYLHDGQCEIPDLMLQHSAGITAYIYVRAPARAETILTVTLPVTSRPRPENYVLPGHTDYQRLLPEGGTQGQYLRKSSDQDYDVEWADGNGGGGGSVESMTDAEVDEICK